MLFRAGEKRQMVDKRSVVVLSRIGAAANFFLRTHHQVLARAHCDPLVGSARKDFFELAGRVDVELQRRTVDVHRACSCDIELVRRKIPDSLIQRSKANGRNLAASLGEELPSACWPPPLSGDPSDKFLYWLRSTVIPFLPVLVLKLAYADVRNDFPFSKPTEGS